VRTRHMQRTVAAATILLLAGIRMAAGASGGQAPPSTKTSSNTFDPCVLLTKQDAAAAVGEPVGEPESTRAGRSMMPGVDASACEYQSASRSHKVHMNIWRASGDSTAMFRQTYQGVCATKERLAGLGDVACWYSSQHRELQLLKGAAFLSFQINRSGDATEALTTVARKVAARLP
jgi:hypothetical protein